jgi:hypothetical protein
MYEASVSDTHPSLSKSASSNVIGTCDRAQAYGAHRQAAHPDTASAMIAKRRFVNMRICPSG